MNDFLSLAAARYSCRSFDSVPVTDEELCRLLEAARLAPTAMNYQPVRIFTVRNPEKLVPFSPCLYHAPLALLFGYDTDRSAKLPELDFGETDTAIVCTHVMLEAQELGLNTCWVGRFDAEKARQALGIAPSVRLLYLLDVGHAASNGTPADRHSQRQPISDFTKEI